VQPAIVIYLIKQECWSQKLQIIDVYSDRSRILQTLRSPSKLKQRIATNDTIHVLGHKVFIGLISEGYRIKSPHKDSKNTFT